MKVTACKYLNIRSGKPTVNVPITGYLSPKDIIEISASLIGETIDGNSIWYLGTDGNYYWSGGILEWNFILNENAFETLSMSDQQKVIFEYISFCSEHWILNKKSTGMGCGLTFSETKPIGYHINIQFENELTKQTNSTDVISYKGFLIPAVREIGTIAKASARSLPDYSVSMQNDNYKGTVGFVAEDSSTGKSYLVTNYHVLCKDLLIKEHPPCYAISFQNNLSIYKISQPAHGIPNNRIVGYLQKGGLDYYSDSVCVLLTQPINQFSYMGYVPYAQLSIDIEAGKNNVTVFGAISGEQSAKIVGLNDVQPINYYNGLIIHTIHYLLRLNRVTQQGDSGSVVLNHDQKIIGLVVANDDTYTYVILIENILSQFNPIKLFNYEF